MKTYIIHWNRSDYGRIHIDAENEQEAREKFEQGDYKDIDMNIKGGSIDIDSIEE